MHLTNSTVTYPFFTPTELLFCFMGINTRSHNNRQVSHPDTCSHLVWCSLHVNARLDGITAPSSWGTGTKLNPQNSIYLMFMAIL